MPAVSDSSALILFARINRLDLLEGVFDHLIVPPAVWREVVSSGPERVGASDLANAHWIRRHHLAHSETMEELRNILHPGEAEAIALAGGVVPAVPILIDDLKARRVAMHRGLSVVGTAGVLVLAKEKRLIDVVRPLLGAVIGAGLYLGASAIDEVLRRSDEH